MTIPAHDVPGRFRFRLPMLRRDIRKAAIVRARVRAIKGVHFASANALTGSLIVRHDDKSETRRSILAAIAEFRPTRGDARPGMNADQIAEIIAKTITDHLIEIVLRAAIATLA